MTGFWTLLTWQWKITLCFSMIFPLIRWSVDREFLLCLITDRSTNSLFVLYCPFILAGWSFWAILRLLSCLGLTKTEGVKSGKTIISLVCTNGYVYMDISWYLKTCVCSFQCSGIYLHLHSFFVHVEANGLTGYLSARLGSESAWTRFFGGQSNSSSSLGVVGYHWVIPISWKTPASQNLYHQYQHRYKGW